MKSIDIVFYIFIFYNIIFDELIFYYEQKNS